MLKECRMEEKAPDNRTMSKRRRRSSRRKRSTRRYRPALIRIPNSTKKQDPWENMRTDSASSSTKLK